MEQGSFGFGLPAGKKRKTAGAIVSSVELLKLLLKGKYVMRRKSHDQKYDYCLFEGKNIPLRFIKTKAMGILLRANLLRFRREQYTVSRKALIQLHGNNKFKKAYKLSKRKV